MPTASDLLLAGLTAWNTQQTGPWLKLVVQRMGSAAANLIVGFARALVDADIVEWRERGSELREKQRDIEEK